MRHGSMDGVSEKCELILEGDFETQAMEQAYMEPESAICVPRHDGVIEIYGSMQQPYVHVRRSAPECWADRSR